MGANDFRQALADVRVQETCFHGRHIGPQIYAGLSSPDGWRLKDYQARGGYEALTKILLNSENFYDFFKYVEVSTFDIASDAFATFKVCCF